MISRKREGEELSSREIALLVDGYTQSEVPDYQMSAFAMAVFFKGMTPAKTAALTRAMMASGDCFSHRPGHPPVVGKHSTGGPADLRICAESCWIWPGNRGNPTRRAGTSARRWQCPPPF